MLTEHIVPETGNSRPSIFQPQMKHRSSQMLRGQTAELICEDLCFICGWIHLIETTATKLEPVIVLLNRKSK